MKALTNIRAYSCFFFS